MRRFLVILLICTVMAPAVFARKPKDKAGKVTDMVYKDKKLNFSITLDDGWKYSIQKNKSKYRFILVKKNYDIPSDYIDAPDYTMIPRITLWVDTTSMSPFVFIDSLLSPTYKSKQKNNLYKEFDILNDNISEQGSIRERLITRKKKAFEIGKNKALRWSGQMKYRKEVATSSSSIGGKRVIGAYGGSLIAVKNGDTIYMFHMICEWNYFDALVAEMTRIVQTIKFE